MLLRTRLLFSILLLTLIAGCDATDEGGITTLLGSVVDARTNAPIEAATVNVVGTGQSATTDASGFFSLEVEVDSTGAIVPLQIFASGYNERLVEVAAVVEGDVSIPDIVLESRSSNGGGDGGDGNTGGGIDEGADEPSGPAASITLVGRSSESIGVAGAGADETATLTFIVLDAAGNPVDLDHAVDVNFSIANGPGGGEFIAPTVKATNASGRVQTTISSGTRAGIVQALATATNEDGDVINSLPVVITITGGLPDDLHFSIAPGSNNFPGYTRFGLSNPITAYVGDIYANPVQPGTAVYFTTDAGIIEGSGVTDGLGQTTVTLISAAPLTTGEPPAACPASDPTGYALVTASTADMNQETIEATTPILFSGETTVTLETPGLELQGYTYTVDDIFGHPLAPGSAINVIADGVNVEAVGDVSVVLGDYLCPGVGTTNFTFAVVQGDEAGEDDLPLPPEVETITISVSSPNGNFQLTRSAIGGGLTEDVIQKGF